MNRTPALSLWRPWTTCITQLGKGIENRGWATTYRGPMYLHGSMRFDDEAVDFARDLGFDIDPAPAAHPGGVVSVVNLVDICTASLGKATVACSCGRWAMPGAAHWQLGAVRRFQDPVPCKGRQGLWWPTGVLARQLEHAAREAVAADA